MKDLELLSPMLFYESTVFDSNEYIYELKFDGIRCLAYLDNNKTRLINKRYKDITYVYPELANLHSFVKQKCIIDGEIVIMNQGKPDFYQLQKRSLLTNSLKISLAQKKNPAIFVVFDILSLNDKLLIDEPLLIRKNILNNNIIESENLVYSRYVDTNGIFFFDLTKEKNLEGIVAKKKDSKYYPGKRSNVWLKMKVYQEKDLIVCGYVPSEYGIKEIVFGLYDNRNNLYKVASINTSEDKTIILEFARKNRSQPHFEFKENTVWIRPYLVGRVKYMMETKKGALRQAVFLGLRDDKIASDLKNN